jgi:hypothetical protein
MSDDCVIDDWILTEKSFDEMDWAGDRVQAFAFGVGSAEFILDLDRIVRRTQPKGIADDRRIWFAPATLVFGEVFSVDIDIVSNARTIDIDSVRREDHPISAEAIQAGFGQFWTWTIDCKEGVITFKSSGFKLYFRTEPARLSDRKEVRNRIGKSFERARTDGGNSS